MGCLVARKDFVEEHPDAVRQFLEEYAASAAFANDNTEECAKIVAELGIIGSEELAQKAIPNCNIVCIQGAEMKEKVSDFFQVLFDANPQSIGGALPDEDFYYQK